MEKLPTITTLTRRPKWQHLQPQQTPRILHFPRRPRKRAGPKGKNPLKQAPERRGKLESLFGQEREFSRGVLMPIVMVSNGECCSKEEIKRRERVEEDDECNVMVEEEKWRFQAEMLRAECKLLRMERDIAVKKMERRRVHVEETLRFTVQTLLSGRKTKDGRLILEEDIRELTEKLEKLQKRSRTNDLKVHKCHNFDTKALHLQRQLQKGGGDSNEVYLKEIQEMAEASLSINSTGKFDANFAANRSFNMELLTRKMEGLSKENLLEMVEDEYGSMLSTSNTSASSSSSTSRRLDHPDSSFSARTLRKDTRLLQDQEEKCSGRCKAIVRRVVEQVRAETEQWSQMQEMLGQVRDEMMELQNSRDFWEDRALQSDYQIQNLKSMEQEWKQKARSFNEKANELENQVFMLNAEIERLKKTRTRTDSRSFGQNCPNEMEKRVLICRLKENISLEEHRKEEFRHGRRKLQAGAKSPKRVPFRDVGNSSTSTNRK